MRRENTKEEIDTACALADHHLQEIVDGLMPHENLESGMRQDIRRRLIDMFYEGIAYAEEKSRNTFY